MAEQTVTITYNQFRDLCDVIDAAWNQAFGACDASGYPLTEASNFLDPSLVRESRKLAPVLAEWVRWCYGLDSEEEEPDGDSSSDL